MQVAIRANRAGPRAPGATALIRRSGLVAALKGAQSGLMLLALALAARWLGADAYGRLAGVLAWAGMLAVLFQLGLPPHLLRRVAAFERDGDDAALRALLRRSVGAVVIAAVGGAGLALSVWASGVPTPWPTQAFVFGALAAGALAFLRVLGAWLQARGRVLAGQVADALVRPGGLLLGVAAAMALGMPASGTSAAWLFIIAAAMAALVAAGQVWFGERQGSFPSEAAAERRLEPAGAWLAATGPLLGAALLHAVMANADVLMLGALADAEAAGAYHAASRIALTLGLAMAAVGTVTGPHLARAAADGDAAEQRRIAVTSSRLLAIPAVLALPLVVLAAEPALGWLGEGFAAGAPALVGLWIGQLVNLACGPVAVLLNCHERERAALAGLALGAAANLGLNALLIPPLGATGAAIATATSMALWNLVLVAAVRRHVGVDPTVLGRAARAVAA